jgi:GNAT superfamily N-acetyltransferase
MAEGLSKQLFTAADLPDVQDFDCGDKPYEKEVSDWLKGPEEPDKDCAVNSIKHPAKPSRVWLYKLDEKIVGFGALAKSEWRWPGKNKDPYIPLSVIIWVAVQKEFWGKPEGTGEEKYSVQILDDLLAEAEEDAKTHPALGLFVHKDNGRAIKFYKNAGFSDELVHLFNKQTKEVEYYKMFVILDDEAFKKTVEDAKNAPKKK